MRIEMTTSLFLVGLFAIAVLLLGAPLAAGPINECGTGTADSDCDDVPDAVDNCLAVANGAAEAPNNQCDTDQDGYGNKCDADLNNDFGVGIPDFGTFVNSIGKTGHPSNNADTNCDGFVGIPDFGTFTSHFGASVGPSGLSCAGTTPCP